MPHSDQMLTSVSIGQRCVLADINTEKLNMQLTAPLRANSM